MPDFSDTGAARQDQLEDGIEVLGRAAPDPLIGKTIGGRFKIVGVIARGGMGKVYKAEQAPLGRICALKVLSPKYEGDRDPEFHKRFFLEASIAARLSHPNTVTVFDYGQSDDIYYIAMEFVDGRTLHRVLRDEGPFNEARACHVARQICRSLREAHQIGVVHRDLKPGNVLLTNHGDERDNVKVLDFGLVKDVTGEAEDLTQQGLFMGSPKYMAPEQILGAEVSARTDIYSLGVMLYEMLCGKVPFDKGPGVGTLMAHVNEAPPPMNAYHPGLMLSEEMLGIVMRCLEKDPMRRFGSMDELLLALKRIGGEEMLTGPYDRLATSGPYMRSRSSMPGFEPHGGNDSGPSGPMRRSGIPAAGDSGPSTSLSLSGARPAPMGFSGPPSMSEVMHASQVSPAPDALAGASGKRRFLWITAVLVLGFGGIILTLTQTRGMSGNTAPTSSPQTAAPVPTTAPAAPMVPAKAGDRVVHIESDPAGATVMEGNETLCGGTPCDVTFRGAAAEAEHTLSLSKKGYQTKTLTVGAREEKVKTSLTAAPAGGVRTPPGNNKGSGTTYKPDPYKNNPY